MGGFGDFLNRGGTSGAFLGAIGLGGAQDFLFGTEGEPGGVIDLTDPEFSALRKPTAGTLRKLLGEELPSFDPNQSAPVTETEQAFLDKLKNLGLGESPLQSAGREQLLNTIQGGNLNGNPFLDDAIASATRPVIERFNDVQLPGIISQFKNAGQTLRNNPNTVGSSAFLNQARLADRDLANTVGDIATRISFENFNQERGRQEAAINTAENIKTTDIDNAVKNLQAQQLPRLIDELGIDRGIQEFNTRISNLLSALSISGNLTQGKIAIDPGTPATEGNFGKIALGAAAAFSSRKLKDSVREAPDDVTQRIGKLDIGIWKYKPFFDDPADHIGPYAEEWAEQFGGDGVTVNMLDMIGVLLKSNQEMSARITQLEAKNG